MSGTIISPVNLRHLVVEASVQVVNEMFDRKQYNLPNETEVRDFAFHLAEEMINNILWSY